ncbi:MAG TPA: Holliday junction resolvase RuvX [Cyclobacteriaceae bacterium]|nr:Holliday junction resolvase RuvX [Cyclobacteriaceae bacterium]
MGRILAIDYGLKRTGLAVTDPLRIIATALDVVETSRLVDFLRTYFLKEAVEEVVIGMPKRLNNMDSEIAPQVRNFVDFFRMTFPDKPIFLADERFTSSIAHRAMIDGGMRKSERKVRGNVDKVSATLILQNYMESRGTNRQ